MPALLLSDIEVKKDKLGEMGKMTRRTLHKERRKKQKREELMIITASATIICSLLVGISQTPVQANVSTAEQTKPVFDTYYQKQDKLAYTLTQEERELIERVVASEGRGEDRTIFSLPSDTKQSRTMGYEHFRRFDRA